MPRSPKPRVRSSAPTIAAPRSPAPPSAARAWRDRLAALVVALFAVALYAHTLGHDFTVDDAAYITTNKTTLRGFQALPQTLRESSVFGSIGENFGPYRPAVLALFAVEVGTFGTNPHAFHAVQVLLYGLLCALTYLTLRALLAAWDPRLPLVAALLFTAHPIHTEVVANIKGADELLSLLFTVSACYWSVRFVRSGRAPQLAAAFACFVVGLFAKESAVTFAAAIPMALIGCAEVGQPAADSRLRRTRAVFVTAGLAVAALIFVAVRAWATDPIPGAIPVINNALAASSASERYASVASWLLYDLRLLVVPHPLSWDYGYNQLPLKTWSDPIVWVSVALHVTALVWALTAFRARPLWTFCILYYFTTISIVSNAFVLILATVGERFLFAPSLAFCVAAGAALLWGANRSATERRRVVTLATVTGVVLALYSAKTVTRAAEWRDNYTLFEAGVRASPNSYRANMSFGVESLKAARAANDPGRQRDLYASAAAAYRRAVVIYGERPEDWFNLGLAEANSGNPDAAIEAYSRVQALNPGHPESCYNLGSILVDRHDYRRALEAYACTEKSSPDFMDLNFMIGKCYQALGEPVRAVPYYEAYLRQRPTDRQTMINLVQVLSAAGNASAAAYYASRLSGQP